MNAKNMNELVNQSKAFIESARSSAGNLKRTAKLAFYRDSHTRNTASYEAFKAMLVEFQRIESKQEAYKQILILSKQEEAPLTRAQLGLLLIRYIERFEA
tara:strand:+ start:705 stop:1004 length:300 start_codon:yes stop_codon:yes gene_type:complete